MKLCRLLLLWVVLFGAAAPRATADVKRPTLWDGWRPVLEIDYTRALGTESVRRYYTWGPDVSGSLEGAAGVGGLLEIVEVKGGAVSAVSLPLYDGIGNVVGLVDADTGARVASYQYGPFGEVLGESGARASGCPFRYQTRLYDEETGLSYFGQRYYDAKTQGWLSRDPLREGGGVNLYAYCHNDPVTGHDPIGLAEWGLYQPTWYEQIYGFFVSSYADAQRADAMYLRKTGHHLPSPDQLRVLRQQATSDYMQALEQLGDDYNNPAVVQSLQDRYVAQMNGSMAYQNQIAQIQKARLQPTFDVLALAPALILPGAEALEERGIVAYATDDVLQGLQTNVDTTLKTRNLSEVQRLVDNGKIGISSESLSLLWQLRRSGSSIEVPATFNLRTLSELQQAAQVEFGLFEVDGNLLLVRGKRFEISLPKGTTSVVAHSHPGENIFALRPSFADVETLKSLNQTSSIIVNEKGLATEFTSARNLLRLFNTDN